MLCGFVLWSGVDSCSHVIQTILKYSIILFFHFTIKLHAVNGIEHNYMPVIKTLIYTIDITAVHTLSNKKTYEKSKKCIL
jgi:hypothetical protein